MENILMRFCRQTNQLRTRAVASKMGVSQKTYRSLEKGDILLTEKQARQLGELYHVNYSYFYKEAQQLDLLLTRQAIIAILKWELDKLIERKEDKISPAA